LRGRGVSGFPQTDHSSSDEEEQKTGHQATRERSRTPEKDAQSNDRFAAETIREKTKRYAAGGKNNEEKSLQRAEFGVRGVEMIPQERNKRYHRLPRGEVDKIDQSKYSKDTNLAGSERNGLH